MLQDRFINLAIFIELSNIIYNSNIIRICGKQKVGEFSCESFKKHEIFIHTNMFKNNFLVII